MKFKTYILILLVLFLNFQFAAGAENDYGIVKAWFNGKNATVTDVQLRIGEPVEVKVEVISKIKGDISLKLKEPGTTKAFIVQNGPSNLDEWIDTDIEIGSS
jgi:sarcinarray family protein